MHNIEIEKRRILKDGLIQKLDLEIETAKGILEIARTCRGAFEVEIERAKECIAKCELYFYEIKRYEDNP